MLHDTTAVHRWVLEHLGLSGQVPWRSHAPVLTCQPATEGRGLLLGTETTTEEVGAHSRSDVEQLAHYRRFIEEVSPWVRHLCERRAPDVLDPKSSDLPSIGRAALGLRRLGRKKLLEFLRVMPMSTADALGEWFESDILKAALAAPAFYATGLGPRAPGTNTNLILTACLEHAGIAGGPAKLVEILEAAARAAGVEILAGVPVSRVDIAQGRAQGVTLADGSSLSARRVAASCDPRSLLLDLVPAEHLPLKLLARARSYRARGCAAKVHLGLDGLPDLACRPGEAPPSRLRIGPTLDHLERAADAVKYRQLSARPALDVYVPSLDTPGYAPDGHHVLSVLVHCAPHDLEDGWSPARAEAVTEAVLATLEPHLPTLRDRVVAHETLTPADLATDYRLSGGHLLHGEPALDQLLVRPLPECADYGSPIDGLFLCGSGSHPGGGITCAPGALAARRILRT